MVLQQHQHQNVPTSKCPTNTSLPTKSYSCKTFLKVSQKISSWPYFLSSFISWCLIIIINWQPLCRYPNLHEVRLIPTKRDIAFVEYIDEGSAGVAKDALHNYKLDGENKIKVMFYGYRCSTHKFLIVFRICRSPSPGNNDWFTGASVCFCIFCM